MAEEKQAKKVYTLEEIKFNEENKTMAILSCIPLIGLIMFFVEKKDLFVRYIGAQYGIIFISGFALPIFGVIPVLGWLIIALYWPVVLIFIILGIVKISKGERYDLPLISGLALKLMGSM